jgi:hypothetical protein
MREAQLFILLFKIVLVADVLAILAFILDYSRLAPWYRNPIGRTIVTKDILLLVILIPGVLSLFFEFNRLTSRIAAWIDLVAFALIAPVMVWRIVVFERIHREKRTGTLPIGEEGGEQPP